MNQFAEHLPWRVASLAGLMVGGISLATGADAWTCLLRVGAAFLLFGVLGLGLRAVLQQDAAVPPPSAEHRGKRFDKTTPDAGPDGTASPGSNINDVK